MRKIRNAIRIHAVLLAWESFSSEGNYERKWIEMKREGGIRAYKSIYTHIHPRARTHIQIQESFDPWTNGNSCRVHSQSLRRFAFVITWRFILTRRGRKGWRGKERISSVTREQSYKFRSFRWEHRHFQHLHTYTYIFRHNKS